MIELNKNTDGCRQRESELSVFMGRHRKRIKMSVFQDNNIAGRKRDEF